MAQRVTLADVAARAGVSTTSASMILSGRTGSRLSPDVAARVRRAARELDYRPNQAARSLRLGKTQTVGLISDEVTIQRFASAMVRGALDVAELHSHTVLIAETGANPDRIARALDAMMDRQTDGIIIAAMAARRLELPGLPAELPVVLIDASAEGYPSVLPAEYDAGLAVVRCLTEHGHRRIAVVGEVPPSRPDLRLSATIGNRLSGIRQGFAAAGLAPAAVVEEDDWEPAKGYEATRKLLASGPAFTALIALNDRLAFGAYQAVQERGLRIPDDLSVVSFDDEVLAGYLRPGLTTVRLPYLELGQRAMSMLLSRERSDPPLVEMPLVVRDSVRRIDEAE